MSLADRSPVVPAAVTPYSAVPVHRLIEGHAAATPQAIAVRFREATQTYADLNARANRLARYLIAQGVGPESRVMVCLEPGPEIAVALLAIMKSGGVYVPLEPTYPEARLRVILEDTQPRLMVTAARLAAKLPLQGFEHFHVDVDVARLEGLDDTNPDTPIDLEQTAYIFYTSGTTGKPKGVMASHANLIQYILSAQRRYAFAGTDVMPAIARFSFSISLFELLSPLAVGGTLMVLEREHVLDLERMSRTFQEITFFHAGPSLLRGLMAYVRHRHTDFSVFDGVRHASCGGDMVPPELLEDLKTVFRRAEVFVIYGCSEVACMGLTWPVPRERLITRTFVGSPFDNAAVCILDEQRKPAPAGVVGEICFAGGGVVKGYLNRDELTAEKFIEVEGRRFYCTGDVGRVNPAGEVEMLGRRDFQIQLRGMRIELAEVEYHLRKAPGVRDGVVMARTDAGGEKVLVAYVVFHAGHEADAAAVRQYMLAQVPDYMVPTFYVALPSLPLNNNMKIDRHALPPLQETDRRAAVSLQLREPQTETETQLAALWKPLLRVGQVGLDDNFFELGGHSLLAVELILVLEKRLGVKVDGMEVLRESLEVLSSLIDVRLGRPAKARSVAEALRPEGEVFENFYFGPGRRLYGVFHDAGRERAAQALLVCSAIGQENLAAHFVLRKLAKQVAARGVPVLRFDYSGCGNSLGEDIESSCQSWCDDIAAAADELKRRAPQARLVVLGLRLGALLAWSVQNRLDIERLILWDPIVSGADHVAAMQAMHRARVLNLQQLRWGLPPRRIPDGRELMGFTWSHAALDELRCLEMRGNDSRMRTPVDWLASTPGPAPRQLFEKLTGHLPGSRFRAIEYDCHWADPAAAGDILPDAGFSQAVGELLGGRAHE